MADNLKRVENVGDEQHNGSANVVPFRFGEVDGVYKALVERKQIKDIDVLSDDDGIFPGAA